MRARDFITEVGDKPYRIGRWKYGMTNVMLPDGREMGISFEPLGDDPLSALLSFSVDGQLVTTGGGDAYRILATLTQALSEYVSSKYPELLVWGVDNQDSSRIRLFDRLANRWLQLSALSGYENLTERKDLWPEDLELVVNDMHGPGLKIYVLASPEYMDVLKEDTTANYDDPRGSTTLSESNVSRVIGPPVGKDGLLTTKMKEQLEASGYKYAGQGAEHSVWIGPDGYVYKIMPPRYIRSEVAQELQYGNVSPKRIYLTHSQRSFLDWVDYCRARPNNPFLPYYDDWQTYVMPYTRKIHGKRIKRYYVYIQCRTERLFPLPTEWSMNNLSLRITDGESIEDIINDPMSAVEILSHIGEDGFRLLYHTIQEIEELANSKGYRLDLHGDNFMVGEDGQIVINDPFFIDYTTTV